MGNSFNMKIDLSEVLSKIESKGNEVRDSIFDRYQIRANDIDGRLYYDPSTHVVDANNELEVCKFKVKFAGQYKISANIKVDTSGETGYMKVYVNDTKVAEATTTSTGYVTKNLYFNVDRDDIVKLTVYSETTTMRIYDIKLYGYIVPVIEKL